MITTTSDTSGILTEWLNANLTRTYPLNQLGALQNNIPNSILIDAAIYAPSQLDSGYIYVSSFCILPDKVVLQLGMWYAGKQYPGLWQVAADRNIGIATTDADLLDSTRTVALGGTQNLHTAAQQGLSWVNQVTGQFTIGKTKDLPWQSQVQVYQATDSVQAPTRIHPHCIHITGRQGVSALVVDGVRLTGQVVLQAGPGIRLNADAATNTIHVNIDAKAVITQEQAISRLRQLLGTPITSINGSVPDTDGNFLVTGLDCTQVQPYAGGITLSNPCSKPCCGESTSSDLNTAISILQESRNTMNDHYISLSASVNAMTARLALLIKNLEN